MTEPTTPTQGQTQRTHRQTERHRQRRILGDWISDTHLENEPMTLMQRHSQKALFNLNNDASLKQRHRRSSKYADDIYLNKVKMTLTKIGVVWHSPKYGETDTHLNTEKMMRERTRNTREIMLAIKMITVSVWYSCTWMNNEGNINVFTENARTSLSD